jgi:hypothetical protein
MHQRSDKSRGKEATRWKKEIAGKSTKKKKKKKKKRGGEYQEHHGFIILG